MTEVLPKPEELYAEHHARLVKVDQVEKNLQRLFYQIVSEANRFFIPRSNLANHHWHACQEIANHKIVDVDISGEKNTRGADLVLANNQGGAEVKLGRALCHFQTHPVKDKRLPARLDQGSPVLIHPENSFLESGEVSSARKVVLEAIINHYLLPKMRAGARSKISLLLGHSLDVLPDGFGKKKPMHQGGIALRGISYDTSLIEEQIRNTNPNLDPIQDPKLQRSLNEYLMLDIQSVMSTELSRLIIETRTSLGVKD